LRSKRCDRQVEKSFADSSSFEPGVNPKDNYLAGFAISGTVTNQLGISDALPSLDTSSDQINGCVWQLYPKAFQQCARPNLSNDIGIFSIHCRIGQRHFLKIELHRELNIITS
jgi:hypothetical protein